MEIGYQRTVFSPDTWTWEVRPIIDKTIGRSIAPVHDQQQVFFVTDLNVSLLWEINIGVGIGATGSTDHLIFKAVLGRRFD